MYLCTCVPDNKFIEIAFRLIAMTANDSEATTRTRTDILTATKWWNPFAEIRRNVTAHWHTAISMTNCVNKYASKSLSIKSRSASPPLYLHLASWHAYQLVTQITLCGTRSTRQRGIALSSDSFAFETGVTRESEREREREGGGVEEGERKR
jgi:hypothetical protein